MWVPSFNRKLQSGPLLGVAHFLTCDSTVCSTASLFCSVPLWTLLYNLVRFVVTSQFYWRDWDVSTNTFLTICFLTCYLVLTQVHSYYYRVLLKRLRLLSRSSLSSDSARSSIQQNPAHDHVTSKSRAILSYLRILSRSPGNCFSILYTGGCHLFFPHTQQVTY